MYRILVVDDDPILQETLQQTLSFHNFYVRGAFDGESAVQMVMQEKFDLVVMDVNMPKMNGLEAMAAIKRFDPTIVVIILTAYSNVADAVKAVKEGAYNYLEKPMSADDLVALIRRALKAQSLVETSVFSAPRLLGPEQDKFIGESDGMKKVFKLIDRLARVNTPVFIRGESGTGKELVAKAIHYNSPRKDQRFVAINLAAIPETLLESELFGHEKGAFTGATERKIGKFQYADGGTIFLDEIGDISPNIQVKLLRVLQEHRFTPVGSNREIKFDARLIVASHRDFEKMIKEDKFREDLYYRLNVLPVFLPPLRERQADLPLLIDYYCRYFNHEHKLHITGIQPAALQCLREYTWPGNIRQLRNVIEYAFIMETSSEITLAALPPTVRQGGSNQEDSEKDEAFAAQINVEEVKESVLKGEKIPLGSVDMQKLPLDFNVAKELFEKEFILYALKLCRGRSNQTALKGNIPKKTLLRKIEKYEINPRQFYDN